MLRVRIIPCLLLKGSGLVKTMNFKNAKYIGDPINAVRIFNDKEADELVFLDIEASINRQKPQIDLISQIASECFMPLSYGGGIKEVGDIKKILSLGVEKVIINSAAIEDMGLVSKASELFGSQSIVISIDVKKNIIGKYKVYINSGKVNTGIDPVSHAINIEKAGAGEIFLNSIERDGSMKGYDLELINQVSMAVNIPVIACGGAGKLKDFTDAVKIGCASAVSAGSMFVFHGKHRAVLISYPSQKELTNIF